MTKEEITAKYKRIHDEITAEFYPLKRAGLIDDDLQAIFDTSHGQNWTDLEAELIAEGYIKPPEPPIDVKAEIKALKDRLALLEKK